jgi:hypothetical protein
MSRIAVGVFLVLFGGSAFGEEYPRLAETRTGFIDNLEKAEALYQKLENYDGYFEFKYIGGNLCAKKSKLGKCKELLDSDLQELLPFFEQAPFYLTQLHEDSMVVYVAFDECAGLHCVIDAIRYRGLPSIAQCDAGMPPTPKTECLFPLKDNWYIRYQFLDNANV